MRTEPPPPPRPPAPAAVPLSTRVRFPLLAIALWALVLLAWSWAARDLLPIPPRAAWDPEIARHAPPLARYDSGWYRKIALDGYGVPPGGRTPSEHVFFPLYPALVGGVARLLSIDPFSAGIG